MITNEFKRLLAISQKKRYDSYTDQFNRVIMVKVMTACCVVMSISWYQDPITCFVPEVNEIKIEDIEANNYDFVSQACWIQGVYVYRELMNRIDNMAYYGIPQDIEGDGLLSNGQVCTTKRKFGHINPDCKPMEKTFFLQYQWMPFLIGALAALYYIPFLFYAFANIDIINLRQEIKKPDTNAVCIVRHFFNLRLNTKFKSTYRIVITVLVKLAYVMINVIVFIVLDEMLNDKFADYGMKWYMWSRLNNTMAFNYMGMRDKPKPGNELLPPFGYCELYETGKDIKHSKADKHKFICELSQNVLYQYCLVVMWFFIVMATTLSALGLVIELLHCLFVVIRLKTSSAAEKRVLNPLKFRELQYLECIRHRNGDLYDDVVQQLRERSVTRENTTKLDE